MKRLLWLMLFMVYTFTQAKVLIIAPHYNRPDFIEIQHKMFQKFLKDEYEFVVFNDATDATLASAIKTMCNQYGLQCFRIPQEIHNRPYLPRLQGENYHAPAVRNCNAIQYALNEYGFTHDDILVLMDSDLFLIKEFSFKDYLKGYDLAGLKQGMGYLWIGFVILDMAALPNIETLNFNCGRVNNIPVDAGGHSYYYLQNNPTICPKFFAQSYPQHLRSIEKLKEQNFDQAAIDFIMENPSNIEYMLDNSFLHYRGGTNWDHKSTQYHQQKTSLLNTYITNLLNQ